MNDKAVKSGVLFAIAAYTMWGIAPMYFKLIGQVPAMEILMHRIIWSVLVLVLLVAVTGKINKVKQAILNPKVMQILLISGLLLAANWFIFIWAINNNHLLDASLGYYINPLLNVFLGRLFLGERLRRMQKVAVGLALSGVAYFIVSYGQLPWVALALAGTFGIYGLLRKQVAVDSLPGLLIESVFLLPPAIVYWIWFAGEYSNMLTNDLPLNITLICAGIVTTAPLLCFTAAAKRIMFSTLGFFQYIGPSLMFVLAAAVYGEPLDNSKLVMFAFVWLALGLFSYDSLRQYQKVKKALKQAQA
ncbi:EamA family transporter RarD [Paraglaciecola chathamensis]|jgi:chloramphenicol-sensitive protein RarD|uniref:Chloramphenicol resistance permease RarD n=3 Tax=Paraglaciecola chathamensis TaxID=368405 RepID=A0A8H9IDN6_9ALTE|nr:MULTISPECIES: EamA family transporter RarD [Paraglaciecola]AEE21173.1 RarD protein, DMT superfamily transporter [Glaciecola sp. 4H-3-7+YE-5]MDO6560668.1 EamA family transporter RarD [Paraglaciecola chathamensis]GGZ76488.1 chloramphenicol resistance permease RarD [Paraglaciecola oceanifecundans]|tara:strand:+ start:60 stop:968 length:909 start_codon:yes stop_codon:yes gene_type:complete